MSSAANTVLLQFQNHAPLYDLPVAKYVFFLVSDPTEIQNAFLNQSFTPVSSSYYCALTFSFLRMLLCSFPFLHFCLISKSDILTTSIHSNVIEAAK